MMTYLSQFVLSVSQDGLMIIEMTDITLMPLWIEKCYYNSLQRSHRSSSKHDITTTCGGGGGGSTDSASDHLPSLSHARHSDTGITINNLSSNGYITTC